MAKKHSECGASGASRWLTCLGSVALSRTVPRLPSTEHADRGTKLHSEVERFVKQKIQNRIDGSIVDEPTDEESRILCNLVWDTLYERVFEHSVTGKNFSFETTLTLLPEYDMFGTVDLIVTGIDSRGERYGWIIDYKFGYHEVPIEDNAQIAFYACALQKLCQAKGKPLAYIRTAILQPASEVVWKESKLTEKNLESWMKRFRKVAHDIYIKKVTKLKAGPYCGFCPARAICPEYAKNIQIDKIDFELPNVQSIPVEKLITIWEQSGKIKSFLVDVEEFLKAACSAGALPGYELKSASRRRWREDVHPLEVEKALGTIATRCELLPITVLEKKLDKAKKEILQEFLEVYKTAPRLTRIGETSNVVVFDAIEQKLTE
jgi:CRISPR/Cas system-associated exonuclease Cas4 (RecB family)